MRIDLNPNSIVYAFSKEQGGPKAGWSTYSEGYYASHVETLPTKTYFRRNENIDASYLFGHRGSQEQSLVKEPSLECLRRHYPCTVQRCK